MALQDFFQSVTNVALRRRSWQDICHDLLRLKDEATVLKLAQEVLQQYAGFDADQRLTFFSFLLENFRVDAERLQAAIAAYQDDPNPLNVQRLNRASQPGRRQLFEVFNMTPGGTHALIDMRSQLLGYLREHPELGAVDGDLEFLFGNWFNRGFLSLERIDWRTPAFILEKLIAYEAVHEISGWDDLQRRVTKDRRCYAFFHPALPHEPIIFVQVALTDSLAASIDQLIREPAAPLDIGKANTAIFYSISNCQTGLRGIAFGDLLIKQVVELIAQDFPHIRTFATLSPIPGFGNWVRQTLGNADALTDEETTLVEALEAEPLAWVADADLCASAERLLPPLCAHYLQQEKRGELPLDPVSRFHLRNGARLERINWLGDRSHKGLKESYGMLVNYVYDVGTVTRNHERYVYDNAVITSSAVSTLGKKRG